MDYLLSLSRGLLGIAVLLGICYLLSKNRKAINWKTVGVGLFLQLVLGILILKVPLFKDIFSYLARFFVVILDFTDAGADFVLGDWPDYVAYQEQGGTKVVTIGYVFAFKVLPTIIFFSALSSLLYYLGILQLIIKGFAWVMVKTMGLTGPESLAAAANVFIGQTEAPLVVKPYLEGMSKSEILCLMTGGMATIAGGVFAAYVGFLGGDDEVTRQLFATHLLTASIMSAPAAIVAAKILFPQEKKVDLEHQELNISRQDVGSNMLDAISRGTTDGIKLAVNVGAMLLVFTAFVEMMNYFFINGVGSWTGLNAYVIETTDGRFAGFNIEYVLGVLFSPIAWLLGVPWQDATMVGQLLGLKTTLNEFFAYAALEGIQQNISEKSVIIATYALCGFANFASIGIQIGGISAIAPGQRKNLTELGVLALVGGTVACFLTAIFAGLMYTPMPVIESGVSHTLSIDRAEQVDSVAYDLFLEIPSSQAEPIPGQAKITFQMKNLEEDLLLDFRQPSSALTRVRINGADLDPQVIKDHIRVNKSYLKKENNLLEIDFTTGDLSLNRNEDYLYTLFVPDRASTAIPFLDQPNIKATYQLTLELPLGWSAVANGPLVEETVNSGRKTVQFGKTRPFSTYVFAFAAGKFQQITSTVGGREMNMFYRESDAGKVAANQDEIFRLHQKSIEWMETYSGIPMPFQKFDFALIPGFQYGGMEHIGAIFYRESSLMLEPDATQNQKLGRASLIAHETAHMWFGDLVTMDWFNDVWLKEVFANFFAAKIVEPSFPEINHDLRFLFSHRPSAMSEDRSEGSHPIQQDLDNLKNAGTLYGRIIYQKAPIVMRQLEDLMGAEAFQKGLQRYLSDYAYGNATWDDLIKILDEETNKNLASWSEVWVKSKGMPHYSVDLNTENGRIQNLGIAALNQSPSGAYWEQATEIALFYEDSISLLKGNIAGERSVITAAQGFPQALAILPNLAPTAYGYFKFDEASSAYFLDKLASVKDPRIRGAILLGLQENMIQGNIDPQDLLSATSAALAFEQEPLNRSRLLGVLQNTFWQYLSKNEQSIVAENLENRLWELLSNTSDPGAKSSYWGAYSSLAYSSNAQDRLWKIWQNEIAPPVPLNESRQMSLAHTLAIRMPEKATELLDDLETRVTNPDRLRRVRFVRPALSAEESERDAFFESLKLAENRSTEPWATQALGYLNHPLRAEVSTKYILPSLELMEEIQATGDIFFPRSWAGAALRGHNSREAADIVRKYLADHPDFSPRLKNKVLMAADPLFRAADRLDPPKLDQ